MGADGGGQQGGAGSTSTSRPLPRWKAVSAEILDDVLSGVYDDALPGELELAQRYGVSRGTIRSALKPLRELGHISAHRGRKPRVVAGGHTALGPIYSMLAAIRAAGMRHESIVLHQGLVVAPHIAGTLSQSPEAGLFHVSRIRLADGVPLGLDDVWLPATFADRLGEVDFSVSALYAELDRRCGIVLDGGEEQLTAIVATSSLSRLLQCDEGAPLLQINRIGCYRARPIEFRRSYFVGGDFSLSTAFGSGSSRARE